MPKRTKTNTQFVKNMMEFSSAGPMSQLFIIEAIRKYAEQVTSNADQVKESMQSTMIDGDSWIRTAQIILDDYEVQYK